MDRDTAARAIADAYTAARNDQGYEIEPPYAALDAGRTMERWLHDHGFHIVTNDDQQRAARDVLRAAADAWTQGAWADTPRHADRGADRIAAAQYAGDWLRARADRLEQEPA